MASVYQNQTVILVELNGQNGEAETTRAFSYISFYKIHMIYNKEIHHY